MYQLTVRRVMAALLLLSILMGMLFTYSGSSPVAANENLLRNPSFEGQYRAFTPELDNIQVASDWTPWWVHDLKHDPAWAQPEYKPAQGEFYANRVKDGERAQQYFTFYRSHKGGMYQQISNVTPGTIYRFSIWLQVWSSTGDNASSTDGYANPHLEIGIDPNGATTGGGANGVPSSVVWSGEVDPSAVLNRWHQMSIEVKAESSTIAVYVKSSPEFAVKHNDVYLDSAELVAVGQAPAPVVSVESSQPVVNRPGQGPWTPGPKATPRPGQGPWTPGPKATPRPGQGPWTPRPNQSTNCWTQPKATPRPGQGPWTRVPGKNGVEVAGDLYASAPWTPRPGQPSTNPCQPAPAPNPNPNTSYPSVGGGFGLGGQTHSFSNPDLMKSTGMTWVKMQIKWSAGDNPNDAAGRIQDAHARGFKILLSIPGAHASSIDYNSYVDYLAGVAKLGPDAIEVWNEQNIDREWPNGQINPTTYVNNMLKPAYQKIKAANPNVMVISGAPAPTGYFGGGCAGAGCDDKPYIEGMAAAGAANYMDCIGIHYNEGIMPPSASSGDPRGNSGHYTRYYPTMLQTYKNAFGGNKPLCFTELGYLSGDDYGGLPGGFSWAKDTSIQEHADWLAQAVTLAKNDPSVRMLIIFNVDFTLFEMNGDPQAGFAMIRKDGGCPACSTVKAAMGK